VNTGKTSTPDMT